MVESVGGSEGGFPNRGAGGKHLSGVRIESMKKTLKNKQPAVLFIFYFALFFIYSSLY